MPRPEIADIQKSIGYKFKDPGILLEALTHKSFKHENPDEAASHNERLEFIGDSVLGLVVADYLYRCGVGFTEAEMSRIKSHLVKGKVLAELASGIALGDYLRIGKGEEGSGGRKKISILANAMEAVFGAVFEDGGYVGARKAILRLLKERLDEATASGDFADYKSELQELCQMRFGCLPEYRLVSQEGKEHKKVFTFEVFIDGQSSGRGRGATKKEAQAKAASQALKNLKTSG
jgi:ribonuclease-3